MIRSERQDAVWRTLALSVRGDQMRERDEELAIEEPMEIRVLQWEEGRWACYSLAVSMRTPGHDFELALGFLFSEGVIASRRDVREIRYCTEHEGGENIVDVVLAEGVRGDPERLSRNVYTTSSCGICGRASLELVRALVRHPPQAEMRLSRERLQRLPEIARQAQRLFARTGGVHASALFDEEGNLRLLREDVGRHNAMDKIVGHLLLTDQIPASRTILLLSGRASFELVQKALVAGIPIVVALGAPSSLAVATARDFGLTLIGFLREDRFTIYAGAERVSL